MPTSSLQSEVSEYLKAPSAVRETALMNRLGLDAEGFRYFLLLYQKSLSKHGAGTFRIFEEGRPSGDALVAYPTAVAPDDLMRELPWVDYRTIEKDAPRYEATARQVTLWKNRMHAGTGSTISRKSYLARIRGVKPEQVTLGAKSTDLFVEAKGGRPVSIAEALLLQSLKEAEAGKFKALLLEDLVGPETEASIEALWKSPSLSDPTQTYEELLRSRPGIRRVKTAPPQAPLPALDENSELSLARRAPGGHAFFALLALRAAVDPRLRPKDAKGPLVSVISNGEDLCASPDPLMVGWMVENQVPIVMVTTEKTAIDLKGGQIALLRELGQAPSVTIVEQAQAKASGQLEYFENLGLGVRKPGRISFFNTNLALFNLSVLGPLLDQFVQEVGEEEFLKIITPDLILNEKSQKDPDGVVRKYRQLEGAMGSSLLNLDRHWRSRTGKPLVHFINVDARERTRFFSPIKTAFDFFMQFHSDLYRLNRDTFHLVNRRPGALLKVELSDAATHGAHYQDVETVLGAFEGVSLHDLDGLRIEGRVLLKGARLAGQVKIRNLGTEVFDLGKFLARDPDFFPLADGHAELRDVVLEISGNGQVTKQSTAGV